MKDFMKVIMDRFSILTIALVFGLGSITACTASERSANDKNSAGGTEQNKSAAIDNKQAAENKSAENESVETGQTKTVKVYDGRGDSYGESKVSDKEKAFVGNIVKEKDAEIKNLYKDDEFECNDTDLLIEGVAKGSFTKPNSSQTAYLYRKCMNDTVKYPSFLSGIIIAENENVISHYIFGDIVSFSTLKTLPDINQNGLSELALTSSSTMAYYTTFLDIYEFDADSLTRLGTAKVFTNSLDEGEKSGSETAYNVTAQTAKSPVFFQETYHRKSNTDKWKLKTKSTRFSLETSGSGKANEGFKKL